MPLSPGRRGKRQWKRQLRQLLVECLHVEVLLKVDLTGLDAAVVVGQAAKAEAAVAV